MDKHSLNCFERLVDLKNWLLEVIWKSAEINQKQISPDQQGQIVQRLPEDKFCESATKNSSNALC